MLESNGGVIMIKSKIASISADNNYPGREIGFVLDHNPSLIFQSQNNNVTIDISLVSPGKVPGWGFVNLSLCTSIKLRYCLNSSFEIDIEKDVQYTEKNTYFIDQAIGTYQYFQVYITSTAPITLGCIFPGLDAWQFPENFTIRRKHKYHCAKRAESSDDGMHYESPDPENDENETDPPEWEELGITFKCSNATLLPEYRKLIRPGKKILIPNYQEGLCYYGIIPNSVIDASRDLGEDQFSLDFWECAVSEPQEAA